MATSVNDKDIWAMVLELQELVSALWASSAGKAQSPERPGLTHTDRMGEGGWNLSLKSQQLPRIRGMGMLRFLKNVAATAAPEVGTLPIISSQESVSETILASIAPSFVQDCAFLLGNFLLGPSSYWTFLLRTALCRHPGL